MSLQTQKFLLLQKLHTSLCIFCRAEESIQIQRESGSANTIATTTTVTLMYFNWHYLQNHILIDQTSSQCNYSHFKWNILLTLSELKPVSHQAVAQTCLKPCHGWSLSIRSSGDLTEVVCLMQNLFVKSCGLSKRSEKVLKRLPSDWEIWQPADLCIHGWVKCLQTPRHKHPTTWKFQSRHCTPRDAITIAITAERQAAICLISLANSNRLSH